MADETILVVDDDADIREIITMYLEAESYKVLIAINGYEAVSQTNQFNPDLIILDMVLPGLDGIEVCQAVRKNHNTPILFLSSKSTPNDKTVGLIAGGDDYISKPFDPKELLARVKAHLRRNRILEQNVHKSEDVLRYPNLTIDLKAYSVTAYNREIVLSYMEFQLLTLLAQNPNVVITIEQLYKTLWHTESFGDYRTLLVHISNIRKKIEPDPKNPVFIHTLKGIGYKFITAT
ncbi:MAG TPA: response regulator transcription factor [Mobilitalea sp.]|nr:response regulator transcription factor [Mobilitalea sp.]